MDYLEPQHPGTPRPRDSDAEGSGSFIGAPCSDPALYDSLISPESPLSEVPRRELRPYLERQLTDSERGEICDGCWRFIDTILEIGSAQTSPTPRQMGFEVEVSLVTEDGNYAVGKAAQILSTLGCPEVWQHETGSGSMEYVSPPALLRPGALTMLGRHFSYFSSRAVEAAGASGLYLMGTGISPALAESDFDLPDLITPRADEQLVVDYWEASARDRRSDIPLQFRDGSSFMVSTSASAWAVIHSLHLTVQTHDHSDALRVFNTFRDSTALFLAISANCGVLNGKPLDRLDYRPTIVAGSGSLAYNFDTGCGIVTGSANSLREAFELLFPREPTTAAPAVWLSKGNTPTNHDAFESLRDTLCPSIQLRIAEGQPGVILVEYRPMSVQLSTDANMALAAYVTIVTDFIASNRDRVVAPSSQQLLEDIDAATRDGMGAEITQFFGDRAGQRMPAATVAYELLSPAIAHGLAKGLLGKGEVSILEPLVASLNEGRTGAETFADSVDKLGLPGAIALHSFR